MQTALDQAIDSDTLYVAGGTYTGTGTAVVSIINKSITLYGCWDSVTNGAVVRDPAAYPTTLDGESQRRVVRISGNISPTLDGFLIMNGRASEGAGIGLYLYPYSDAAAIIRHNVITNNVAFGGWGGGIQVDGGRPLIEHNRIMSNTTPNDGGGVAIAFGSRPTLKNNLISRNSAQTGGGIRLRDTWTTLLNNTIAHNTGTGGQGIYASNTTITLTNNIIVSNTYGLYADSNVTETIGYNDVWGNTAANYGGLVSDTTESNGNISLNPLFVSEPDGDYYLSQVAAGQATNSPGIDAGSDSAVNLSLDDRTTRTDREVDIGTVDMGYHYRVVKRIYLPLVLKN